MTVPITLKDKLKLAVIYKRLCKVDELTEQEAELMHKLLTIACYYPDIARKFDEIEDKVLESMQSVQSN